MNSCIIKYPDITAIILTGGKSSRMGQDKAALKLNGVTLIERSINLITPLFTKIILSVSDKNSCTDLSYEKAVDKYKGFGPLIGIYSALLKSKSNKNFIISCDMPYLNKEFISFLTEYKSDKSIIIPIEDGEIHPLCGTYSIEILPSLELWIKNNLPADQSFTGKTKSLSLRSFLEYQSVEYVDISTIYKSYNKKILFNINTKEDYEEVKRDLENL